MTQVILHLENNIKAKRLIEFLYSLDFVKVEDSLKIQKDKSDNRITKEKDALFFSSAGSWKDIDTEKI